MPLIPTTAVIISPERQRQEFDPVALTTLANSIISLGLMHPIVLRETEKGYVLVAGERRLRAIEELNMLGQTIEYNEQEVPMGQIPFSLIGADSELLAEEAELDENLKRTDLTWQELANAHTRLHKLRAAQKEQSPTALPQTVADTALELMGRSDGAYQNKIRKELIVAQHLDKPEVQKAKTMDEAFKVLKKLETRERNCALAADTGAALRVSNHELYNEKCLPWMEARVAENPEGLVDVICTDPPYGMGADKFNDGAGRLTGTTHDYDDSYENWQALMRTWCPLSYKICTAQAHAYVFCDIERFAELKAMMQEAGWYVFRTPFVYVKPDASRVPLPDKGPRRQFELLLYAIKGGKLVTRIYPDVITATADRHSTHGACKPVSLFKNLLQRSVIPGNVVLDTFAGTGPVIPAAHYFNCRVIAIEAVPESYAECVERLKGLDAITHNWEE